MKIKDILVINPGSTSTKLAIFTEGNSKTVFEENLVHNEAEILVFPNVASQSEYRKEKIMDELEAINYDLKNLSAIVGRGGMAYGLKGGGYKVDKALCDRMSSDDIPQHASSLGALLSYAIAEPLGLPSFIYDSPMGCELLDIAEVTGIAGIKKYGATHLLNSRAKAIKYAESVGKKYEDMSFIVCHMGGGITANAQKNGKVIDVAAYDDGPMAPERSGGVPLLLYTDMCFDGKHTKESMKKLISGEGGVYSYLGTKDMRDVEKMIQEGNEEAKLIYDAMAYQVAKAIAGLTIPLKGQQDVIILTGGIAHSKMLTDTIIDYCKHLGKIVVMAGESEMEALANGTLRMLEGSEEYKTFE